MNTTTRPPVIQRRLDQAQRRYNGLRLLRRAGWFLTVASGLAFALLFCVERSWLTSRAAFDALAGTGIFVAAFGGLCLLSVTLARQSSHAFLASAIEGARPGLRDRLNTLVDLEGKPSNHPVRRYFAPAIAQQAARALGDEGDTPLYPRAPAWAHFFVGILCTVAVAGFAVRFQPWRNLVSGKVAPTSGPAPVDAPFELGSRNTAEIAGKEAWGEVRIVEPGRDQKLTKLDVVPLRIEMATRDPLDTHEWITSVNGAPETAHPLEPAAEPCFAAYSPLLYLDELKVSDWDVVSYYARARTTKGNTYGSQIYFVEIRPFRDDLMKALPGGGGGKAAKALEELSRLTAEQSRLLRATHEHGQMTYPRQELQTEDRRKLGDSEGDLAVATDHAYGRIAGDLENTDIGTVLSHLDTAETHMKSSASALRSDVVSEGKSRQEAALAELVATRKALMKMVSEHPEQFGDGADGGNDEKDPTAADARSKLKALQQVAEFRDQEKAAQAAMAKLAADEKALTDIPYQQRQKRGKELAAQQKDLIKRLDELNRENPALFTHSQDALTTARADMEEAGTALESNAGSYNTYRSLVHASDHLNDLNKSLNANNERRDLERAYAMKKVIDQSARSLHDAESKPDPHTPGEAESLAEQARQSTRMLKGVSGQNFGPGLSESLSAEKQAELDKALQKFQTGKGKARIDAAATARANLENVSKAFDASRPKNVQDMDKQDALGGKSPGGQQAQGPGSLDSLMEKLQSLALQDQNGHHPTPEARAKQRAELLRQMEAEIPKQLGKSDAALAMLAEARMELTKRPDLPVDAEVLKHLQEKLESMQAEASEKAAAAKAAEGTSVVDAGRAPASYRQRTQRYYETLSNLKR